jgi:CHAT domain-containing protein
MLDAMDGAGILHFAGHSVAAPSSALGSFLVLAPEREDDSGLLYAHELAELEFTAPELVVLTACGSVAPSALYGGGFWGVAKPFLERGTRAVVGALWPVDDSGALQLSIDFHRALQEGVGPAEALRVAQMRALADPGRPVRDWAAFQVLGA